eukprot:XP_011663661.1 PREDICTED: probable methylcrotonoyl-CoA carboxylase beta chain, mitochondrial [Strongylocentrotus purpuratus]
MTTFMQMLCKIGSPRLNVFRPCSSSKVQKTPTAPWQCTRFRTCSSAASKSSETPFVPLEGDVDTGHVDFQTNFVHNYRLNEQLQEILGFVHAGGGEKSMKKHTELNKKIFVRDRLRLLLDDYDNEFLELSSLAGWDMEYGRIPAASNVCGIGKVRGTWCSVSASDATIKGGTSYPITVKKQLRMQEICQQNSLPAIYIIDSGGAFLPLQSEIFPDKNHGGRVFYNEAILSAQGISQIAIVCGSCTAGGAYVPTMADEAIIMHKIGTIFLIYMFNMTLSNVLGIGKVRGTWCTVSASDATIKGGTSYPITVKKQLRMQEICQQNSLPAIYIIDSGGAFLPLQSEIFPDKNHGGRVFYNEAILSAQGISQIAIVCGSCTAGGAYVPTMADEAIIMHKIGTIFLIAIVCGSCTAGVQVSTEQSHNGTRRVTVACWTIGPCQQQREVSGCTDHFASTEEEGFTMGRDSISTLNVTPPSDPTQWNEPLYSQDELLGLVSKTGEVKGQMRKVNQFFFPAY